MVTRWFASPISQARWIFSSVVEVDERPAPSSWVKFVWPLLNFSIHSYTLLRGTAPSPYCVESLQWISARHLATTEIRSLLFVPPWCTLIAEQPCLHCHSSKESDAIKVKHQSRDHSSTKSKRACTEDSVANLKMCYGESVDNFLHSLVLVSDIMKVIYACFRFRCYWMIPLNIF
jgi:hypothetical protein